MLHLHMLIRQISCSKILILGLGSTVTGTGVDNFLEFLCKDECSELS